ncbi:MAG: hypothetical protein AAFO82_04765 [Bacteroidota bacterium]
MRRLQLLEASESKIAEAATTAYMNAFFLHFAGAGNQINLVNQKNYDLGQLIL